MTGGRTLLLNGSYEPLGVIPWQRAITMLCLGKVEVLRSYETALRSIAWTVPMPAVVKLRRYVHRHRVRVALSRRNVFLRDGHACQYCGVRMSAKELTCDHVVPRSQGGRMSWDNVVAACAPCNRRKGGRTPDEARMKLLKWPERPRTLPPQMSINLGGVRSLPEAWRDYLASHPIERKAG